MENVISLSISAVPHEEADQFVKESEGVVVVISHTLNHTIIAHEPFMVTEADTVAGTVGSKTRSRKKKE